ncbi:alpha-L-rhamnosidase, partial [Candidatus Poribacteria bacterium]
VWEAGDLRGAPRWKIREVPEEAIAELDVWSLTAWDRPVEGSKPTVENPDALLTPSPEWTVIHPSPEGDVRLLLDFGRELLAYIELEVDAPEGTAIDFNLFEGIQEGEILLTHGLNNSFRYTCRAGRQRYRTFVKRGFRYAFVVFRNLKEPVKVRYIAARLSTYPTPERGEFVCDDERLNRIWRVGAYTLRLCMDDTYLDCPAYEQTHWVGDARNEALINWAAFGDPRITAHCLLQTADSLKRSPLPESHVPSGWPNILTAWSLLWIRSIREYWQFTGDKGFIERIYPALRTTCDNFLGYLNEEGLLEIEAWNMLDWAPMDTPGRGVVTHQNMLLVRALREAAELAELLGRGDDAGRWREKAEEIKNAINEHLWSEEKGAFVDCIREDGSLSPVVSQQTNTMALLCGCVDGERAERVRKLVLDPPEGVVTAGSPFFMFFLFEVLAEEGLIDEMLRLTRERWGFMLDKGATTFWETFPGWAGKRWTRSWCHAWSSAPTYFLSTEVLGVYPEEPGFEVVRIAPKPGDLTWCRGRFPTVKGDISVEWRRPEGGGFELRVDVPEPMRVHAILPVYGGADRLTVSGGEAERVEGSEGQVEVWLEKGGVYELRLTE